MLVGTFSLFLDITKIFHEEVKRATIDHTQDWQLFCSLLRSELEGASLDKVENNYLYVRKHVNLRFGLSSKGDFRKTNANGRGYQPMIHHIKNAKISQEGGQVKIILSFEKGGRPHISLQVLRKRKLRASILLYTLVISLLFSLLLQYYLQGAINARKQRLLQRNQLQLQLREKIIQREKHDK